MQFKFTTHHSQNCASTSARAQSSTLVHHSSLCYNNKKKAGKFKVTTILPNLHFENIKKTVPKYREIYFHKFSIHPSLSNPGDTLEKCSKSFLLLQLIP